MKHILMVSIFLIGLILKVSSVAGVEAGAVDKKADVNSGNLIAGEEKAQETAQATALPEENRSTHLSFHQPVSEDKNPTPSTNVTVQMNQAASSAQASSANPTANPMNQQPPVTTLAPYPTARSDQPAPAQAPQLAYRPVPYDEPAQVLSAKESNDANAYHFSVTPLIGGTRYVGRWNDHISNSYSVGLLLEFPIVSLLSFEAEGGFGRYNIGYSFFQHNFNQYQVGGNLKLYIIKSRIQPYIGGGVSGLYYENMTHGPLYPWRYNEWVGNTQIMGGLDFAITEQIVLGARASWLIPTFSRPTTADNGLYSYPYYEEAAAMNTQAVRVMGSVRVRL